MKKILIIKTGALGDVVIATGPIRRIIENHAGDEIWLLTSPAYRDIFSAWNNLHTVTFRRKGFMETVKIMRWIRRGNFQRLYDLQSSDRTGLLCLLSGVKERVGNHPRPPYTIHPDEAYDRRTPIFYRLHEILESAAVGGERYLPELPASRTDKQFVGDFIRDNGLQNRRVVLFHAGASERHPEKCWPHFSSLAKTLAEHGYCILWTGSADEREDNRRNAADAGIDVSGRFTINQLAELAKHASFAMTNDSGPMHVFATAGIPVYAFFGPTNWRRHHAVGQEQRVISADDDAGIYIPASLEKISTSDVINRLHQDGLL